jgi:hypothetical protein
VTHFWLGWGGKVTVEQVGVFVMEIHFPSFVQSVCAQNDVSLRISRNTVLRLSVPWFAEDPGNATVSIGAVGSLIDRLHCSRRSDRDRVPPVSDPFIIGSS